MNKIKNIQLNTIYNTDWTQLLDKLDNNSVDFICIDPPYGKIQGMKLSGQEKEIDWDVNIDWNLMFQKFNRVIKKGGTIAVFGQQPTYSKMILANENNYKYEWIWVKNNTAQGYHADKMPLNYSENIAIFIVGESNTNKRTFNKPIVDTEIDKNLHFTRWYAKKIIDYINIPRRQIHAKLGHRKLEFFFYVVGNNFNLCSKELYNQLIDNFNIDKMQDFIEYDKLKDIWDKEKSKSKGVRLDSSKYVGTLSNVINISKDKPPYLHTTQKPIKLMEFLIERYTNESDIVLDCFAGSGSTLLAAKNLNRQWIGSELNDKYYKISKDRLK